MTSAFGTTCGTRAVASTPTMGQSGQGLDYRGVVVMTGDVWR